MTRMFVLVLALLAPSIAAAQELPPLGVELPPIPTASPRMEARIASLVRVAERTRGCMTLEERGVYYDDERCEGWFESLSAGSAGVAHAIGRVVLGSAGTAATAGERPLPYELLRLAETGRDPAEDQNFGYEQEAYEADPAYTGAALGSLRPKGDILVPYFLHAAARELASSAPRPAFASGVLESVRTLTMYDPVVTAPWTPVDDTAITARMTREIAGYTAWLADHASERPATWARIGLARARDALTSEDLATRYAGMARLAAAFQARHAVRLAVRETLARTDLSGEARRAFLDFATEQRLLGREERARAAL